MLDFVNRFNNYDCNLNVVPLTVYEVEDCIRKLKHGKAPGVDELSVEHIVNCHPIVIIQLTCMYNCMIRHGYVPDAFGTGVVIPVIKNADGDSGSVDNYRGITLSPVLSKLFEMCMLLRLSTFLKSSDLQFGFKENYSCAHAIYIVKEVLNYFNKQHSTLNLAALDISKAFDKVNHYILFNKLLDRGIPADLIKVFTARQHSLLC